MAFTTWTAIYNNWLDALADRNIDAFFASGYENAKEMRTTYTTVGSVTQFTAWLKSKADDEAAGLSGGEMVSCIGGN